MPASVHSIEKMKTLPFLLPLCLLAVAGCATVGSGPILPPITSVDVNESPRAEHRIVVDAGALASFRQQVDQLPGKWVPTMVDKTAITGSAYLKNGDTAVGEVFFGATWIGLQVLSSRRRRSQGRWCGDAGETGLQV